mmetsp:Transcript_11725/g.20926  ORF Transcript_11725/g.20926 Transcript_11725/m.20926 type:complete len:393 (-) Transcript_11725:493-1671(-)
MITLAGPLHQAQLNSSQATARGGGTPAQTLCARRPDPIPRMPCHAYYALPPLQRRHHPDQGCVLLDEVGHIHGHLFYLGVVELLNVAQVDCVALGEEVDGHALAAEAARAADAVDVVLAVGGQVVVDHQRHLLHVDAPGQQVRGDEHARGARAELAHDDVPLALVHVPVHGRDREVALRHLLRQPVHLAPRVAVDDGLGDGQRLVQVAQRVQLPLLALHRHIELLDALQGELVALHQDADGLAHEFRGHLQHVQRHGRAEQRNLNCLWEEFEHIVNLLLEATGEHLVGLVQNEELQRINAQRPPVDHVEHTPWGSHHHVHAVLQRADIIPHGRAAHAAMHADAHEVRQGDHHFDNLLRQLAGGSQNQSLALANGWVHLLKHRDGKGGSLTST